MINKSSCSGTGCRSWYRWRQGGHTLIYVAFYLRQSRSDPHPFISLLQPAKGKRLLPRVVRHLSSQQMLTVLTLLVACFSQLDVVIGAPILDSLEDSPERQAVDNQTQLFLSTVMQTIFPVIAKTSLRLISGLVGLLMERCELHKVIQSRVSTFYL